MNALQKVIDEYGPSAIAKVCGVSHEAVRKWRKRGRLPRTEWTGETSYVQAIEQITGGKVSRTELRPDLYVSEVEE